MAVTRKLTGTRLLNQRVYTVVGRYMDNDQTFVQSFLVGDSEFTHDHVAKKRASSLAQERGFEVLFVVEGTLGRIVDEPFYEGRT